VACPFCGSSRTVPIEDAWSCQDCKREYPTLACKCKHPDCWEWVYFVDYCEHHKNEAESKNAS